VNALLSGSPLYPVCGLPGGVSKGVTAEEQAKIHEAAQDAVEFAKFTLQFFHDEVMGHEACAALLRSDSFSHDTYYMGLVDEQNRADFYDGQIRVVDPDGQEFVRFEAREYLEHLEERVEPWSYMKILFLKNVGWKGFAPGKESGVYRVGPLARLNACDGLATPTAQAEYERMFDVLGGKPVHNTLAYHWARLVEVLYAAEKMERLAADEGLTDANVRSLPSQIPEKGFGVCEAPRGTLFHHYETNENGIVGRLNLVVATQNNAAALCMSVEKAAQAFIKGGHVTEGALNTVETAFRAYDPCLACATHCLGGDPPWTIKLYDRQRNLLQTIQR
jgi:F420-non-reducing hydrogenase large subunit